MTDLSPIIGKLRQAKGPSRELFEEAYAARFYGPDRTRDGDSARYARYGLLLDMGAYLEAAVILVPEGADWSVGYRDEADPEKWYEASVDEAFVQVKSTPAIALCIASLEAIRRGKE